MPRPASKSGCTISIEAAAGGALLHGLAGDAAASDGQRGLLPTDLLVPLRRLVNPEPRPA